MICLKLNVWGSLFLEDDDQKPVFNQEARIAFQLIYLKAYFNILYY